MYIYDSNYTLIALNKSEIQTIISALETDWNEWSIQEAGVLLSQFEQIKQSLSKQENNFSDDSV
ncbi:hypothetical protein [Lysinibacillus sp. RC79]|uniref:hypothetical protein n=1 Tax=Lysinibacillus sp. RC79 TaxID=3156296 RepID=UPI0035198DFC